MEIDIAGNDGSIGPFFQWSANGTKCRAIAPANWYLRDAEGKTQLDLSAGAVLDLATLKTGWCRSEGIPGVAPEWRWNPSPSQMMPDPGTVPREWKKGISIRIAYAPGKAATWEQSGSATWEALVHLSPQLRDAPAPNLVPQVKFAGTLDKKWGTNSTTVPLWDVVKWVERPDSLKSETIIDTAPAPAPAPAFTPPPAPAVKDAEALF